MTAEARRVGIMGGTFDPIHHGHLICAEEARWRFSLDEVIFMPAGVPWQKDEVSSAEDRYLMTLYATGSNEHFSVSRLEIDRAGPTYTLDTLRALHSFYGDGVDLYFITGTDAVAQILTWKEPEAVLAEARLIAANRPGYPLSEVDEEYRERIEIMEIPALAISSTEIRQRVHSGQPIIYLTPAPVVEHIYERGLYG